MFLVHITIHHEYTCFMQVYTCIYIYLYSCGLRQLLMSALGCTWFAQEEGVCWQPLLPAPCSCCRVLRSGFLSPLVVAFGHLIRIFGSLDPLVWQMWSLDYITHRGPWAPTSMALHTYVLIVVLLIARPRIFGGLRSCSDGRPVFLHLFQFPYAYCCSCSCFLIVIAGLGPP